MQILIVGNPISGGGRGRAAIEGLSSEFVSRHHTVETFVTQKAGDATERASRICRQYDVLVVVGGDGTLNEVLNGLSEPASIPIAPCPQGTANMLARELDYPTSITDYVAMIEERRCRHLDLGQIASMQTGHDSPPAKRFLLLASAGFDAMVTEEVKQDRRGALGYLGYVKPLLRAVLHYRTPCLQIEIDQEDTFTGAMVVVGNTRNYGGVFSITDQAVCDSGVFDTCIFLHGSRLALLKYAIAALGGRISKRHDIVYRQARNITIECPQPVAVQVDGDHYGTTPVRICLEPQSVPLIVPGS